MADVADDGVVLHLFHVLARDHMVVAGRGDEDVRLVAGVIHRHDAVAFHRRLERADRIDLGHPHLRLQPAQRLGAALADLAEATHHRDLARYHHVGRALEAVDQRFAAAVDVVELGLGHRVVDIDGGKQQTLLFCHLVEAMHTGRGFFRDAFDLFCDLRVPVRIFRKTLFNGRKKRSFLFTSWLRQNGNVLFCAGAEVDEQRGIAAIIQDHVRPVRFPIRALELEDAVAVIPVLLQRFALVGEYRRTACGNRCRSMILSRKDVAGCPTHLGP